jgi:threonine dehydratase
LQYSPAFSKRSGAEVWFKLENFQLTGSFKIRGAFNRLLTLTPEQRAAGCATASSGNHGAAIACALQRLGMQGEIFVPQQTSPVKIAAIESYDGDVRLFGCDGLDTETHARAYAADRDLFYVSPYNDPEVIAGQGSCGVEIAGQLPDVDAVFIAVGGGGLIGGAGSVLKQARAETRIVGCQPANSDVMAQSVAAGRILELDSERTLSDGTAGGVEANAITFDLCRNVVDRFEIVSEAAIAAAMRDYFDCEHQLIEGAAGVAIAGFLQAAEQFQGRRVVVLVCGANISRDVLRRVLG